MPLRPLYFGEIHQGCAPRHPGAEQLEPRISDPVRYCRYFLADISIQLLRAQCDPCAGPQPVARDPVEFVLGRSIVAPGRAEAGDQEQWEDPKSRRHGHLDARRWSTVARAQGQTAHIFGYMPQPLPLSAIPPCQHLTLPQYLKTTLQTRRQMDGALQFKSRGCEYAESRGGCYCGGGDPGGFRRLASGKCLAKISRPSRN